MRLSSVVTWGAFVVALPSLALAWPNGPNDDPRDDPPNDPGWSGLWNLWSYVPEEWTKNPGFNTSEIALGTGIHADRAWQITPGDRRVIVAVLDSGVYWDNPDLVNKFFLNRGELASCKPTPLATPPAGADAFDVDGSGWFDVRDYYAAAGSQAAALADWDFNKNQMIDPQDLLIHCADKVDDDQNGYLDDISGWDFFGDDNDAYDDTRFGHGNGEARDSCSEGNNGQGEIGVCPECTALMVRVGDSFVVDANEFGHGVLFAVDSGASVIQEALGSINNTPLSQRAIDYAYQNNVVVIASAADELAFHHNFPGTNNHTVYVHAVQFDGKDPDVSTTFLNFNTCTNFGMNLLLSTPGTGCSSEATGVTSGHAGLVYSAALKAGLDPPLSAEEAKQVLTLNVDDINVNPDGSIISKFPSGPGWDWHFGYGRNNARKTVDAIVERRIPPEVDILAPSWFEVLYPDRQPSIQVTGRINVRTDGLKPRFETVDWVLEYALGTAPNGGFTEIAKGSTAGTEGVLASWDLSKIDIDLKLPLASAHQNAVTLRLRATGKLADGSLIVGEHRKGFLLDRDPDLVAAFPIRLGGSGESSPRFADLDHNGQEEVVVCLAEGSVHAYQASGTELPGFPTWLDLRRTVHPDNPAHTRGACPYRKDKTGCRAQVGELDVEVKQSLMLAPAVGDLDGNGDLEIVVSTWDGYVFAIEHDGSRRSGWPVSVDFSKKRLGKTHLTDSGFMAAPVLYDLDGKPGLEVIAAAMDNYLYVWHADGSPMSPYPVLVSSQDPEKGTERIVSTPAVGDVDGDGKPEIATGTTEVFGAANATNEARAYLLDGATGKPKEGWPVPLYGLMANVLPIVGRGVPTNPIMADLDFDGKLEISFDTIGTQGWWLKPTGEVWKKLNNRDYGKKSNSSDSPAYVLMNNGAVGYIDPQPGLDFVKGTAGFDFALAFAGGGTLPDKRQPNGNIFDHQISGWDTDTGEMMEGFPQVMDDWQFFNTPAIVDLDNDTNPEVVIGSGGYLVRAFNYLGAEPKGWPKQTGGWMMASVAVGEFDGDGLFEVAITTRDGWLFVWNTEGKVGSLFEWNGYGHDPHNTNTYGAMSATPYSPWAKPPDEGGAEAEADAGPPTTTPKRPGGCDRSGGGARGGWALWLAGLLALGAAFRLRRG
jgi:hypothetical protein